MIIFFPGQCVRILRLAVFKIAQPAVEVRFKDFLDVLWESHPQTPAWRVCAALAALEDGQQLLRFHQHKCVNETKARREGKGASQRRAPVLRKQQSPALSRHQHKQEKFWSVQTAGRRQSSARQPHSRKKKVINHTYTIGILVW